MCCRPEKVGWILNVFVFKLVLPPQIVAQVLGGDTVKMPVDPSFQPRVKRVYMLNMISALRPPPPFVPDDHVAELFLPGKMLI